MALLLLPAALIVLQNDAGTALVFISLIPLLLFWGGYSFITVLLMVIPVIAGLHNGTALANSFGLLGVGGCRHVFCDA